MFRRLVYRMTIGSIEKNEDQHEGGRAGRHAPSFIGSSVAVAQLLEIEVRKFRPADNFAGGAVRIRQIVVRHGGELNEAGGSFRCEGESANDIPKIRRQVDYGCFPARQLSTHSHAMSYLIIASGPFFSAKFFCHFCVQALFSVGHELRSSFWFVLIESRYALAFPSPPDAE